MKRLFVALLVVATVPASAASVGLMPAYVIELPETVDTIFIAETSRAGFHRFHRLSNGQVAAGGMSRMSIGENGVGKQRPGDRRTPLGIYFITGQIDTSKLHEKYGAAAFPLDYPNAWDRFNERSGDGIWVHGVDRRYGPRPARDTDGCIALPNNVLARLAADFEANTTPVLVTRSIRWAEPAKLAAVRATLTAAVERWAASLESGSIDEHLALYSADFRKWGLNKSEWDILLAGTIAARAIRSVIVDDLLLLADPSEDDLFLSRFELRIVEASGTTALTKRIYWRLAPDGRLTIVAEDAG